MSLTWRELKEYVDQMDETFLDFPIAIYSYGDEISGDEYYEIKGLFFSCSDDVLTKGEPHLAL